MPKLRIAILAALALAALCLAVALSTAKRAPSFTARVIEVANQGDKYFKVSVLVRNRARYDYNLMVGDLQSWDGAGWISRPDWAAAYSQNDAVYSHGAARVFYAGSRFPEGTRLRLVVRGEKIRSGLELQVFRLKCRLFGADRRLPPSGHVMQADVEAVTDEFREP